MKYFLRLIRILFLLWLRNCKSTIEKWSQYSAFLEEFFRFQTRCGIQVWGMFSKIGIFMSINYLIWTIIRSIRTPRKLSDTSSASGWAIWKLSKGRLRSGPNTNWIFMKLPRMIYWIEVVDTDFDNVSVLDHFPNMSLVLWRSHNAWCWNTKDWPNAKIFMGIFEKILWCKIMNDSFSSFLNFISGYSATR